MSLSLNSTEAGIKLNGWLVILSGLLQWGHWAPRWRGPELRDITDWRNELKIQRTCIWINAEKLSKTMVIEKTNETPITTIYPLHTNQRIGLHAEQETAELYEGKQRQSSFSRFVFQAQTEIMDSKNSINKFIRPIHLRVPIFCSKYGRYMK